MKETRNGSIAGPTAHESAERGSKSGARAGVVSLGVSLSLFLWTGLAIVLRLTSDSVLGDVLVIPMTVGLFMLPPMWAFGVVAGIRALLFNRAFGKALGSAGIGLTVLHIVLVVAWMSQLKGD